MWYEHQNLVQKDVSYLIHPHTVFHKHASIGPKIIISGKDEWVIDSLGTKRLDATAGLWLSNLGHGNEELADVARRQIRELEYFPSFWGFANLPSILLAEKLCSLAPSGLNHVFFTSGGSEANETAIKTARAYFRLRGELERQNIVFRDLGYHGMTCGALSASGIDTFRDFGAPLAPGFLRVPAPYCYRCFAGRDPSVCDLDCVKVTEKTIEDAGPSTVAAFICEPIMGVGGMLVPPKGYWEEIEAFCKRHGILMIIDEVVTGFGRTGTWFASSHWGLEPHMITMGKGITSGYAQLGGVLINDEIYRVFYESSSPFSHGYTYTGHPVSCAIALKCIEILEQRDLLRRVASLGKEIGGWLEVLSSSPIIGEVRWFGLLFAVELVADKQTREPLPLDDDTMFEILWENGLVARVSHSRIILSPPFILSKEGLTFLQTAFERSLKDIQCKAAIAA